MVIATFCRTRILLLYEGGEGEGKERGRRGEGCSAYLSCNVYIEDELQEGR